MAKKIMKNGVYEYMRAIVGSDGELRWEYKVKNAMHSGGMVHDENVSDLTDDEIINLTRNMLDVTPLEKVELIRE